VIIVDLPATNRFASMTRYLSYCRPLTQPESRLVEVLFVHDMLQILPDTTNLPLERADGAKPLSFCRIAGIVLLEFRTFLIGESKSFLRRLRRSGRSRSVTTVYREGQREWEIHRPSLDK
jgi:hypothetical protein